MRTEDWMLRNAKWLILLLLARAPDSLLCQDGYLPPQLDLPAQVLSPRFQSSLHRPLPEQYIWAGGAEGSQWDAIVYLRGAFTLKALPRIATLYAAGPDRITLFLNGRLLANAVRDPKSKVRPFLHSLDVTRQLRAGRNIVAIMTSQGNRLVLKIVPAPLGVNSPTLVMSGASWKYELREESGWETATFSDTSWKPVLTLGSIEGNSEFFQWNADAGMYRWPGYDGISPFLARMPIQAVDTNYGFEGMGKFTNVKALTNLGGASTEEFAVTLPKGPLPVSEYPFLLLDFGRECTGRLEVVSDSLRPMKLEVQYGESVEEALRAPYLDADQLYVPSRGTVHGPKSAFRYALVRFLGGTSPLRFKAIRLDLIYYPVKYLGSFESSDPLLNRIWEVGAYTSHLCMQDGIWDAPKRDRGRWMGDLDVSGRAIESVFADRFLMQETLDRLIRDAGNPVRDDVNGIPGYSAFWVMGEADYYRHVGDTAYLGSIRDPLVRLLEYLETELDNQNLFANLNKHWPFVDWSPDLNGDSFEARRATQFEFYKAFSEGAWLLREMGDREAAEKFQTKADALKQSATEHLLDSQTNTFGNRWQTNAMAVFSGLADAAETAAIWEKVLSQPHHFMVTPYYNFYVICAMAQAGHRQEALKWIREYWGGMVEKGATSFWEAYDPSWPREDFHSHLQADNSQGYFVSLSHGWSSGATAWLTEQILGLVPQGGGFSKVAIRPDLAGLEWARGAEPTPHGLIKADCRSSDHFEATIELPEGVDADVSVPVKQGELAVEVNGQSLVGQAVEGGTRLLIHLGQAGVYKLRSLL
jgi:hypothetical protein